MQLGYAVGLPGKAQAHHGHIERRIVAVTWFVSEVHETVERDTNFFSPTGEVLLHQRSGKTVDAGGHWRVGGEQRAGARCFDRLVE